jgi:SAM-dependent methyltransferase
MAKSKGNFPLKSVINNFRKLPKGNLLDLGCGTGEYSKGLKDLGFDVTAGDIDLARFEYKGEIEFKHCDITKKLPFADNVFDYVLMTEVIEHLNNSYEVIQEINRVLKNNGSLVLSTPNILNLKSRFRFIFEGNYEYFREPLLEQAQNSKEVIFNLHLVPYRYQELEYLLFSCGFKIKNIYTSIYEGFPYIFIYPAILFQAWLKKIRSRKNGGVDYSRINKILLSKELIFGRHLIIRAVKKGTGGLK